MAIKKTFNFINKIIKKIVYLISPLIALSIFLILLKVNNLYPFSDSSIAWCDMCQQYIPLLNDFKDILSGKMNFSYNLANAGGMSFFGVFFFFLSSPFSFLCIFVDKIQMMNFVNIIVLLKFCMISFSMSFYLYKKKSDMNVLFNISLSLLYAFSVYNFMYYQNAMWLDCVWIFPFLMLSIDYALEKNKTIPYVISLILTVCINYYLGVIIVLYVILYISMMLIVKKDENDIKNKAFNIIISSFISALISSFILIPSFKDYLSSGRETNIITSLKNSWMITSFYTTVPMIFGVVFLMPFIFTKCDKKRKAKLILSLLLIIPLFIEPINKMWHFGSYQAFPSRYAFILIFLFLDLISDHLNILKEKEKLDYKEIIGVILIYISLLFAFIFAVRYLDKKYLDLSHYAISLWGNQTSFEALLRYYGLILLISLLIYGLFYIKFISKKLLSLSIFIFTLIECCFSFKVYMVRPSRSSLNYQNFYKIASTIDDPNFYRIKMDYKLTNVNDVGGLGYPSLSHYTSLTNKDYMFLMKKLGYSSYWMEVGGYGGTSFTDSLLLNKYTIYYGNDEDSKYQVSSYSLKENNVYSFGIKTTTDLSLYSSLEEDTRVNMQENIFKKLNPEIEEDLHVLYSYSSISGILDESTDEEYKYQVINSNNSMVYNFFVNGKQSLYFECFDLYSNSLNEHINNSLNITINSSSYYRTINQYPNQGNNGTIKLGDFENEAVQVKITLLKDLKSKSFSLFGLKNDILETSINNKKNDISNFKYSSKKASFLFDAESHYEDEYLFFPLSYSSNLKAKINQKNVKIYKVFDSLCAIKLTKGINHISIYASSSYLIPGLIFSLCGITLLGIYIFYERKRKVINNPKINQISYILFISLGFILFIVLYISPIIINIIGQI